MSQHIEVRIVIKKDDKILLLKRVDDTERSGSGFEIPGGRVNYQEQPEKAAQRCVGDLLGVTIQSLHLSDVFTYIDPLESSVQRAIIVYVVSIRGDGRAIKLSRLHSRYTWQHLNDIVYEQTSTLTNVLLNNLQQKIEIKKSINEKKIESDVEYSTKNHTNSIIFSDGGSRGNPGPSAAGYIIKNTTNQLLYEGGVYLGITTNNQAEYHGVRLGLEKALQLGIKDVVFNIDSMLVVNQLNGQYVIRNRELWPIHERIKELLTQFEKVTFRHVKREFNQQADAVVNKILDARAREML